MSDEDETLRENIEAQLQRLSQQLNDLTKCRNDMTDDEYNELKQDTDEQLREFTGRLSKAIAGSVTILNNSETSAPITKAFQTPSTIKMFDKNEQNSLKDKRDEIERNMKSGKLSLEVGNQQKLEVLTALKNLGCELTDSDKMFITEETNKLQSGMPSNGFNISDSSNGSDFNMF